MILLTLSFESVRVAPPVTFPVKAPPSVEIFILSVRSVSKTFAPATTCVLRVDANTSVGTSLKSTNSNSTNKSTKALLIGAKTVKGAGVVDEDSVAAYVKESSRVNA